MSSERGPTLTDSTGMGGVIAVDGFDYQVWDGFARLPAWLASPVFESLIFEGLEDLEARFFAPHAAGMRFADRFQAKSAQLAPNKVRDVFTHFHDFEKHHPGVARVQTLVTPSLPPTLQWVARDTDRVRNARPFYEPFPSVIAASDAKLGGDLVKEFGDDLGRFVSNSVEIAERSLPDRATAITSFGLALAQAFPSLDVGPKKIEAAFTALENLGRRSIGKPLSRMELTSVIEGALGTRLAAGTVAVHIRSDRNESNERAIEIDGRVFCGGSVGYPPPPIWETALAEPLLRTARWLVAQKVTRISLGGSYRLSTGFLVGWAFRSATGFDLEIPTRTAGVWATDDHPTGSEATPKMEPTDRPEAAIQLIERRLKVAVGVLRRPGDDLVTGGGDPKGVLAIHFAEPITDGRRAQQMAAIVKQLVSSAATRLKPETIDLYLATPAAFAVALGHRWNAMGPTQLYEWTGEKTYTPTAYI